MSAEISESTPAVNLTAAEKKALALVGDGCDVMDTQLAFTLRDIQKRHPELLWIGDAMGRYSAGAHHPYFGAKLTAAGMRAMKSVDSVLVKVRMDGFGYVARAGRGKRARSASSTSSAVTAVQRAAAKYFRIDACNVITPDDLIVTIEVLPGHVYRVTMPEQKGGAL